MPDITHVIKGKPLKADHQNLLIDRVNQNTANIQALSEASVTYPLTYTQSTPAATWSGTHNLNRVPRAVVTDSAGQVMLADITFPDLNTFVVVHGQPTTGAVHFL